ncbi:MAG TPA: hypothetical protein VFL88_00265 [Gemmatimonadales bacterium]|nr:hypothetical protein [Gemmatimonadales bacterium]
MNAAAGRPTLVRDAMVRHPKTLCTGATVRELRSMFASDKCASP